MGKLSWRANKRRKNQLPCVSIVMNCYNGEQYLQVAIDSVLSQSYENWELIFWDNQSTDKSADIVKQYNDPRIKYFYAPTHTLLFEARNHALNEVAGEFVAFLDVDDWWASDKLENQIPLFDDDEVGLICSNYVIISERSKRSWLFRDKPVLTGKVLNEHLKNSSVGMLTLVVRKSALDLMDQAFNPNYQIIGDFDLVARLLVRWKLDYSHRPLAYYRLHDSNLTVLQKERHITEKKSWIKDMSTVSEVASCSNFNFVMAKTLYMETLYLLSARERKKALLILLQVKDFSLKLKLLCIFCLPSSWFLKLKKN